MKEIIVFGKGKYAESNWEKIENQYKIIAVLDNAIGKEKYLFFKGIKVYKPQEYEKIMSTPILVMVYNYKSIVTQLMELGVDKKNIWIYKNNSDESISYVTQEEVEKLRELPHTPIDEDWGYRRGTPIGRIYIQNFLRDYRENIVGDIMEVGDCTYSRLFSIKNKVKSYTAIHVEEVEGCRKANLETGEGLCTEEFDTMIITQTLAYMYDLKAVVKNIYNSLKPNGYCMVTVTDIGHMGVAEEKKWGTYWGFHKDGCRKFFSEVFGENNVQVKVYGNIKTVVAHLYGLAAEDIDQECIDEIDERYPMIIGIVAHRV